MLKQLLTFYFGSKKCIFVDFETIVLLRQININDKISLKKVCSGLTNPDPSFFSVLKTPKSLIKLKKITTKIDRIIKTAIIMTQDIKTSHKWLKSI